MKNRDFLNTQRMENPSTGAPRGLRMDPSGKDPNGAQGLVTPKDTNSPSLGLFRDPKQLHQLYLMAPAPEEQRDQDGPEGTARGAGDSGCRRGAAHGPLQPHPHLLPLWRNRLQSFPEPPSPTQENRTISRPHPAKPGLPGKTTTVTLSSLSASKDTGRRGTGTPRASVPHN